MFSVFDNFTVVSWIVFLFLSVLSVTSWYIIYIKVLMLFFLNKEIKRVSDKWRKFGNFNDVSKFVVGEKSILTKVMVVAMFEWPKINMSSISDSAKAELLGEIISREIAKIRNTLDSGQTLLAVIASIAPFIGLLGTVLGIFSALTELSVMQTPSLQVISGSVGETLIMTAFGLIVAIPSVFAYNLFARITRNKMQIVQNIGKSYYTLILYKLKNDNF